MPTIGDWSLKRNVKKMKNWLTFVFALFITMLVVGCSHPRAGAQTACMSNVMNFATALKMYRSDRHDKLPSSIAELEPNYIHSLKTMHCEFDSADGCSYIYYPPGKEKMVKEGDVLVILNCRAKHPEVLRSADGERGGPSHLLLSPDLSTHTIKDGQVELVDPPAEKLPR